ncbi:DUF1800 family protein [Polluticaenibacter yanchengensis]|uniref:DUF1800 family protein n=1 Tax=Polluticaenibacter yanchengensis TaxID=3014562 RepID=A0ABT4UGJ9_9BACT|nr:DUF1800 family protein [Chitinophagaceae bacterium LY-5]
MEKFHQYSIRLGFSTQEADKIKSVGLKKFITHQLNAKNDLAEPMFISDSPKTSQALKELREKLEADDKPDHNINQYLNEKHLFWKAFLVERFYTTENPLREKINLFFQNHFVVTCQSVRFPYWIFLHYKTINDYSIGNYKTLVKEMLFSNAILKYLDNQQNKKGSINENLGRELLELFTLGEGNYTEADIKNAALALAGLGYGDEKGKYRKAATDNSVKTFLGKSGDFDALDIVDIIFEQKSTAEYLSEKVLRWFFYDTPKKELVTEYANILRQSNYELAPFFQTLLEKECLKNDTGTQIKNPLQWGIQVFKDLNLQPNYQFLVMFLKSQSMDLYDQPNVKGWKGGQDWMTSQIFTSRNQLIDFLIDGNPQMEKQFKRRVEKIDGSTINFKADLMVKNKKSAYTIINELASRTVYETNKQMDADLDEVLKYDFDPQSENAPQSILNVYQYLAKSPEFQII